MRRYVVSNLVYKEVLETRILEILILLGGFTYLMVDASNLIGVAEVVIPPPIANNVIETILSEGLRITEIINMENIILSRKILLPSIFIDTEIGILAILGYTSLRSSKALHPQVYKTVMSLPITRDEYLFSKILANLLIVGTAYYIYSVSTGLLAIGYTATLLVAPLIYLPELIFLVTASSVIGAFTRNEVISIFLAWGLTRLIEAGISGIVADMYDLSIGIRASLLINNLFVDPHTYFTYLASHEIIFEVDPLGIDLQAFATYIALYLGAILLTVLATRYLLMGLEVD